MTKISKGTIARTVLLAIALINQILAIKGWSPLPFEDEAVTDIVSMAMTIGAATAAWWKNNSVTRAAIKADEKMRDMKKMGM